MNAVANTLVAIVAAAHAVFLVVEMFFWTSPAVRKRFGMTEDFASASKALAANQGLYNGFLTAGLVWSLGAAQGGFELKMFFLGCVIVAGVFGAATAKRSILYVQALPASLAMLFVWLSR